MNTGEFLFNYSKLKLANTDRAGSRALLKRVRKEYPALFKREVSKESIVAGSVKSSATLAPVEIPAYYALSSVFLTRINTDLRYKEIGNQILMGINVRSIGWLGIALVFLGTITGYRPSLQTKFSGSYMRLRFSPLMKYTYYCIPGGSLILSGYVFSAFLVFSFFVFLIMPMVGWPADSATFSGVLGEIQRIYYVLVALLGVTVCYLSVPQEEFVDIGDSSFVKAKEE